MRIIIFLSVISLATSAVAFDLGRHDQPLPRVIGERDPSDPRARVPRGGYQSVTAASKTFRPVAPLPWDELNRRVTPRPKQEAPAIQN